MEGGRPRAPKKVSVNLTENGVHSVSPEKTLPDHHAHPSVVPFSTATGLKSHVFTPTFLPLRCLLWGSPYSPAAINLALWAFSLAYLACGVAPPGCGGVMGRRCGQPNSVRCSHACTVSESHTHARPNLPHAAPRPFSSSFDAIFACFVVPRPLIWVDLTAVQPLLYQCICRSGRGLLEGGGTSRKIPWYCSSGCLALLSSPPNITSTSAPLITRLSSFCFPFEPPRILIISLTSQRQTAH